MITAESGGIGSMEAGFSLNVVGQIARSVRDVATARSWYETVLGLRHLYSFGTLSFFDMGGVRLFLSENKQGSAESILYFKVDDIVAAHRRLLARGVDFSDEPHLIHRHDDGVEEWMAFFSDNEGRPLALMAQIPATAMDQSEQQGEH